MIFFGTLIFLGYTTTELIMNGKNVLQPALLGLGNESPLEEAVPSGSGAFQSNRLGTESPEKEALESQPSLPGSFGGSSGVQDADETGFGVQVDSAASGSSQQVHGIETPDSQHNTTDNLGVIRKLDTHSDIIDDYAVFTADTQEVISDYIGGALYKYSAVDGIVIYTKKRSDGYCTHNLGKGIRHCEVPIEILLKAKGKSKLNSYSVNFRGLEKYNPKYLYSTDYIVVYDVTDISAWNCVDETTKKARILTGNYEDMSECTRLTEQYNKVNKKKFRNYNDLKNLSQIDLTKPISIMAVFDMPINEAVHYEIEIAGKADSSASNIKIVLDPTIGVADCDDLNSIRDDLTADYYLSNSIDCGVSPYNTGVGFKPIGDINNAFTGTFDGNGFTISNLYINRPGIDNVGLFGYARNIEIRNVGLVDGDITGGDKMIGGLVGLLNSNSGGGSITSSYFLGDVTGADLAVGGLVGALYKYDSVTTSYSEGTVDGRWFVGGLIGEAYGDYKGHATVNNSYSASDVTGRVWTIGGFAGGGNAIITNSYSTGEVTCIGSSCNFSHIGGFQGDTYSGGCSNCFWDINTSGFATSDCGAHGKTTTEMKQQATFTSWDFNTVWNITENVTYPFLRALTPPASCVNGILDGGETDVDCGSSCPPCENGKSCLVDSDCEIEHCSLQGICTGSVAFLSLHWQELGSVFYPMQKMTVVFELRDLNGNHISPPNPLEIEYRLSDTGPWITETAESSYGFGTYSFSTFAPAEEGNYTLSVRTLVAGDEAEGSAAYEVKPPDLFIEWIKPIQVVEGVPLVAGKATVVRAKVVNDGPAVDTDLALDYGSGCWTETRPIHVEAFDFTIIDFYPPNNCTTT